MDRSKAKIDNNVKKFVKKINLQFSPNKVILFGSRAAGEAWHYSDYDFIIVSDAFEKMHWLVRISSVVKHWDSDRAVDILPYTQKEFALKKKTSGVVREAMRKGKSLFL